MIANGAVTAMITPFVGQEVDLLGLRENINYQIQAGIHGILLLGTTGEASTLTAEEQIQVIATGVSAAKGKVPLWVGTGSYCTKQTIEKTKRAKEMGADCALIVTPYYNKPTQEGIFCHFEAIAHAVDIPIVVYNVPSRCGTNIELSTMLRIASLPHIVGIKEASGNSMQAADILYEVSQRNLNLKVFSGDDAQTLPLMAMGAVGVVSVLSNLIPELVVDLVEAMQKQDLLLARRLHESLHPLCKAAFIETNPIPIKTAMNLCGMKAGECRLPLCRMNAENRAYLQQELARLQLAIV